MKAKLLKKLRSIARNEVDVYAITIEDGVVVGMKYEYNKDEYSGIFSIGNTIEDVKNKAIKIFFQINIGAIRKRYKKYSRKTQKNITSST